MLDAAPLVDLTQSKLGGNIDTRQMQELPVNGRDWLALTLLPPGSRVNSVTGDSPSVNGATTSIQLAADEFELADGVAAEFGPPNCRLRVSDTGELRRAAGQRGDQSRDQRS
jgi:hypothetical protein